jgi:hypothetical protein
MQIGGGMGGVIVNQASDEEVCPACPELFGEREQRVEETLLVAQPILAALFPVNFNY